MYRRCLSFLLCLCAGLAHAQLPTAVSAALQQAGIAEAHVSAEVRDLASGAPLLSHEAGQALNPASVMKLVTTLAALDTLGPAHTFRTRVLVEGEIRDGVLTGNLVLQGGGDPSLTVERFWLLLRQLRARGLREIHGQLVIDASYYAPRPLAPPFDAYPLRAYNAAPSALAVNFNTLNLNLLASENQLHAWLEPATEMLGIEHQLTPADGGCNGWRDQFQPSLAGSVLTLNGRYPACCQQQSLALGLLPGDANAYAHFKALWQQLGGSGPSGFVSREATLDALPLLDFDSLPLSQLVRDINKYSNNLMAKMLFLNLGALRHGAPASEAKAIQAIRDWLAERGLDLPDLTLENGSGLSRLERISAASLARLLAWAAGRPAYYEFAASLPAVGLEGTQKNRLENASTLAGRAWLKTGSLDNARNLAGYVLGPQGERRVLVCLINDDKAPAAGMALQALLEWAASATSPHAP
jgi:D-alanyl-D-alanine carboxypeptidase/D-alanyl-D-alanine-endopeptidase (penicillin-binding protein 4)